ncbi:MAG: KUP/HAK/KT family potassium transporter [Thermoanaerobaculia bacterium]
MRWRSRRSSSATSPRLTIVHTSGEASGQIYVPEINNLLMVACIALVISFRPPPTWRRPTAGGWGTMVCTSPLPLSLAICRWGWSPLRAALLSGLFLAIEISVPRRERFRRSSTVAGSRCSSACGFPSMTT